MTIDMIVASVTPRSLAQQWCHAREEPFHAPVVAGELALPAGAVPGPFVDIEDVGDVATAVPINPGRHAERIYELTGPASTSAEAVGLISRASGLPTLSHRAYRSHSSGRMNTTCSRCLLHASGVGCREIGCRRVEPRGGVSAGRVEPGR